MQLQLNVQIFYMRLQHAFPFIFGLCTRLYRPMHEESKFYAHEFSPCLHQLSYKYHAPLHSILNLMAPEMLHNWFHNHYQRSYFTFLQKFQIQNSITSGWILGSKASKPSSFSSLIFCFGKTSKESSSNLQNPRLFFNWFFLRNSSSIDLFAWILCWLKSSQ